MQSFRQESEVLISFISRMRSSEWCDCPRAGNRRLWLLSTLRAHAKAPHRTDLLWETLRTLTGSGRARAASCF
jgi:hypothetical protein